MKRVLSILLAVLMVVTSMATSVMASDYVWGGFRNSNTNNGITEAETPVSQENSEILWISQVGTDWTNAPSALTFAEGSIILTAGNILKKLDAGTGKEENSAEMAASHSYGYNQPLYADGKIFCALGNGTVEAFDAETLESLWVYTDEDGGQSFTPITYSNGYVYTGFWNGEEAEGAFVCLSSDDGEVPVWREERTGGFYGSGAVAIEDYIVYGGDNGIDDATSEGSCVECRNALTGELISSIEITGDQRSAVVYEDERLYFTSKDGKLRTAEFDNETGEISEPYYETYQEYGSQTTCTPVVYDGVAYITLGNDWGEPGYILAVDAYTLEVIWAVEEVGYPQCSLLLSTAYEDQGRLYLYNTYNSEPGGINAVEVVNDGNGAEATRVIIFDAEGYEQYCNCSVICDDEGTLYYKNDSGAVFAIAKAEEEEIQVSFRLIGSEKSRKPVDLSLGKKGYYGAEYVTWLKTDEYTLTEGQTVKDLFVLALEDFEYKGLDNNYITEITAPEECGEYDLSANTNGNNGGWLFTINGEYPVVSFDKAVLEDGDSVIFHYVNDYRYEIKEWIAPGTEVDEELFYRWLDAEDENPEEETASTPSGGGGGGGGGITAPEKDENEDKNEDVVAKPEVTEPLKIHFVDVEENAWYYEAVKYVYENKLFSGTTNSTFEPETNMTRGMLVTVLHRLVGEEESTGENLFKDVSENDYFYKAVKWGNEKGIIKGIDYHTFAPNQIVTREQMATIIYRFNNIINDSKTDITDVKLTYTDSENIAEWAKDGVLYCFKEGIMSGNADGSFAPKKGATRAEVATIIKRIAK